LQCRRRRRFSAAATGTTTAAAAAAAADAADDDDADVAAGSFFPSPRRRPSSLIRYGANRSRSIDQSTILSSRAAPVPSEYWTTAAHYTPAPVSAPLAVKGDQTGFRYSSALVEFS